MKLANKITLCDICKKTNKEKKKVECKHVSHNEFSMNLQECGFDNVQGIQHMTRSINGNGTNRTQM